MNLSGTIINKCYIIRELLSENSIGTLWSAQPIFSARQFLLFFINNNLAKKNKENILSFKKKILSSFSEIHENIANIVEIDEFEKNTYLSFEVGDVKSLKEYIKNNQSISINNIYSIIEYISKAIYAMHNKNIIHGLLLPDYVWVEIKQDSVHDVKILNFYSEELREIMDIKIDKENNNYFPPEFTENRENDIDKSSDLYFIGIIFYVLLTSNLDFKKSDIGNISDLSFIDDDTKNALTKIIKKLLNKNKEGRYDDIETFLDDFYLLTKKNINKTKSNKKEEVNDNFNFSRRNSREYFERLDYERKKGNGDSSKQRIDYFNRLEVDRKKYYEKSDFEERKIYFEKLDQERREYYNKIADERKVYLDNIVSNTRKYLSEISDRDISNKNVNNSQKSFFEEITKRTKAYAETITDKIKNYYETLSNRSLGNIKDDRKSSDVVNSYLNNIVSETGRHYKNLVDEAQKYYINLSNEAKKYSDNIRDDELEKTKNKSETGRVAVEDRNKYYNALQSETLEYFKKLESGVLEYSKKIVKEWESKREKSNEVEGLFDKIDESRKDFYDEKKKDATVKYFENIEKEKSGSKEKSENKNISDVQNYLDERNRYYKGKGDEYKEEHTDYFKKSNDRVKQSFEIEEVNKKSREKLQEVKSEDENKGKKGIFGRGSKKDVKYSLRDDFVKNNHWLSFFKKLFNNALKSSGNICIINIGDDNNFDQFLDKFKEMSFKKGSTYIDINCKDHESDNVFKIILKKYDELDIDKKNMKYNSNIFSENEKDIITASELFYTLGEKRKPLIIILREMQFIDKISLLILHKIISKIPDYPLLFICTYREDELNDNELLKQIAS